MHARVRRLTGDFRYFEESRISYISTNTDVRLVGLCTGLITATAVASSNSLTALLPLAIEAVRIAFRTGAHVGKVAQQLESSSGRQSWSAIVNSDEKTVQAILEKFQKDNVGVLVTILSVPYPKSHPCGEAFGCSCISTNHRV